MKNLFCTSAVVTALLVLVASSALAQSEGAKSDPDVKAFENVIRTFLEGNDLAPVKGMIHPEAYIVHGESYESVFNLMSGTSRRRMFGTAQQNAVKFFHAYVNDSKTTAFVVVETEGADRLNARFHTVIFVKSAAKGWQLLHWHAGSKA
jgi:hypothetical protein